MTNENLSHVQPEIREENMLSINSFLRQSYNAVSRHIQDGVTFFKEELTNIYQQAENCVTNMLLPVNNFLKDHTQIEKDFLQEAINAPERTGGSNIVPVEIALLSPMEENY